MRGLLLYIALLIVVVPSEVFANSNIMQWHSSNIQLLRGWEYEAGKEKRTIITVEHANAWLYGDNFFFMDYTIPDGSSKNGFYIEASPRFSLSKITGKSFSYGIIKDVLISTTYEKPEFASAHYLYGGAIDLDIPGFTFFKVNAYVRNNLDLDGTTHQVTLSWHRPFTMHDGDFLFEGFIDFAGEEGTADANELYAPRLLMDIGDFVGRPKGKTYFGVEWQIWYNKFGIDGVTESVPQVQLKWVF